MRIEQFSGALVRNADGVGITPQSRDVFMPRRRPRRMLSCGKQIVLVPAPQRVHCGDDLPVLSTEVEHAAKSGPVVKPMSKMLERETCHIRAGKQSTFRRKLPARRAPNLNVPALTTTD